MNRFRLVLLAAVILCFAAGCGETDSPVEVDPPVIDTSAEDLVRENCIVLRYAVEEFTRYNLGEYPRTLTEYNEDHDNIRELLPERKLLWNPYEWWRLEPTTEIASAPGEIGFLPLVTNDHCIGYRITGFGDDSLIVDVTNIGCPEDSTVLLNSLILKKALFDYAEENGQVYPYHFLAPNIAGKRLTDYFPGGLLLENPVTGENTEPGWEIASLPGQLGYIPVEESGMIVGFEISGFGCDSMITDFSNPMYLGDSKVIANCFLVRAAVEAFAHANNGIYPVTAASRTQFGNTLQDFLPLGRLLINPYTHVPTEPVFCCAFTAGQTGYTPVMDGMDCVGYVITGCGRVDADNIITLAYHPDEE